ncbi:MAG: hypothetical protein MZV64_50180 [Ignavibacteriales bacterium]|nr:hypothetical protein [Ignavibacteriales bacterium]
MARTTRAATRIVAFFLSIMDGSPSIGMDLLKTTRPAESSAPRPRARRGGRGLEDLPVRAGCGSPPGG